MRVLVLFSCGAPSAVAAKLAVEKWGGGDHELTIMNNPVKEEGEDNRRFLRDVEKWIGHPITVVTHPEYPDGSAETVWRRERFMSGPHGANCTRRNKREARQLWEAAREPQDWIVLGFTLEEKKRHKDFVLTERTEVWPLLIDAGLTRQDCADMIVAAGIELPEAYRKGYPNANCRGCVKSRSPTYWNHVRAVDPEVFAARAELSRELGCKLIEIYPPGKGKAGRIRMFLDELPADLRTRPIKTLRMPECGVFCEERPSARKGRKA